MEIRISRFKRLTFRTGDGNEVTQDVPSNLNQAWVSRINFDDYLIRIVAVSRNVAESEFATFLDENRKYIGCLIPGSGIFSDENPNNKNAAFAAYSLIVASQVCLASFNNDYQLAGTTAHTAKRMGQVFASGFFYAVFEKSKLRRMSKDFDSVYYASLFANGLLLSAQKRKPVLSLGSDTYESSEIILRKNRAHPDYIHEIIINLIPYTENPFLRFFYLYQIIEHLMADLFQRKYAEVKAQLDQETSISVTTLRDFVKKLDQSMKESTRINDVLQPPCPLTQLGAEQILDVLVVDRTEFTFADLIYKIRNIIFHDFRRIHHLGKEVGAVSDTLLRYVVEKKIL